MLLVSACSTSITMGNVLLLTEQMHRHTVNYPMCRTNFYQSEKMYVYTYLIFLYEVRFNIQY